MTHQQIKEFFDLNPGKNKDGKNFVVLLMENGTQEHGYLDAREQDFETSEKTNRWILNSGCKISVHGDEIKDIHVPHMLIYNEGKLVLID